MSVIAEGVETIEQADFLQSIGCSYIQGYLYARPMPMSEYEQLLEREKQEGQMKVLETIANLDNDAFWNPKSIETLIFNSFGGASVFEYYRGKTETLRVNDHYVRILGGEHMTTEEALHIDWKKYISAGERERIGQMVQKVIESHCEITDETEVTGLHGEGKVTCLRLHIRVIARAGERYMLYCVIEDIT